MKQYFKVSQDPFLLVRIYIFSYNMDKLFNQKLHSVLFVGLWLSMILNHDTFQFIGTIPIANILDKLSICYKKSNGYLYLIQDWKLTDWWIVNIDNNYVNDFSRDRAKWWPFAFVKSYLKLNDRETFDWFKENFWIVWSITKRKISHKEIKKWLKIQYHRNW